MNEKLNIKNWAEEDRPREKMLLKGTHALSDAELIAILIGSGNTEETAVELARRILRYSNNNLNELGKLTIAELIKNFKGIGEAKAITIAAALELGRRRKSEDVQTRNTVRCSKDIFEIFEPMLADLPHEEFWALFLNRSATVVYKAKISQGGVSNAGVDVKILLKTAIEKLATSIAICHNHPSENLVPSNADIAITQKIKTACQTMDIIFIDHLIVSGKNYYSFADENLI
ncbi:MAG: DNA repair protein RadC [Paludibacter sp.]|jgi:DNA repair protein RadC|nr:DNA repair protein RadC [Paludibacter sp.]